MADTTLNDLNYGHPGAATYDLDSSQWTFARSYTSRQLKQVCTWKGAKITSTRAVPVSIRFPPPRTIANSASIQKDARNLTRGYPQLAPASALLPELARVSAAINTTTTTYDPLVGSLLSFGSITLEDKHEDPRRVVAISTGEAGNILRLAILNKERLSWTTNRSVWVEGPSLKDAECAYWNEEAAPIQQVCFAQSEDRSSLLAVRLPTRTVIFRPTYHRHPNPAGQSSYYHLPPSTIDAHPILDLGMDRTGGAPHADVTFNPDFQLQFAVIDQNQRWSIWDIDHGRKSNAYTMSCFVQGSIDLPKNEDEDEAEDEDVSGDDGWSRILWVGDVNTLLICNRKHLNVVSVKGGSYTSLPCPKVSTKKSSDWILDVQRHPRFRDRFFVLTSSFLILMTITTSSESLDATAGDMGVSVLASWRHYRGADDFTLQLSMQVISDDGTVPCST